MCVGSWKTFPGALTPGLRVWSQLLLITLFHGSPPRDRPQEVIHLCFPGEGRKEVGSLGCKLGAGVPWLLTCPGPRDHLVALDKSALWHH